ncbi:plant cysteine oxidase 2-like isoform X2 [Cynara cardunculus var. scolymus]|uniref:plant cysteine oxidase 2-like isoform X2 n=1 Tax=Cynara cardunculus var. scolymus TaxID=59895 RepID=UPI000D623856|nr:plant cysteine oxidase 2-like isoform X2 [Cynara cardunculus var. scolymus]
MSAQQSERKKRRMRQKKITAVQKLYDTCKEVFANCGPGVVPSDEGIERLKDILNGMTQLDVGVRPNMPYFRIRETGGFPKITYLHLSECDKFSIGIFLLPPFGVLPLHNHPQMTVFSKLLFGTMHIKAYDWVDDGALISSAPKADSSEAEVKPVSVRLAKLKVDSDFTAPCNTSILYPTDGGNMHCFTALTSCAVLDVLGPPYNDPEGRHCQYYQTYPFAHFSADDKKLDDGEKSEDYAWLEEIEKPKGLAVIGAIYNGPKIVEK